MKISMKLAFDEHAALRLLNWLAQENARILKARPDLPGLYASGVRYQREPDETWCDYLTMLAVGHEDCDGLAAARAGELLARGYRALSPEDPGYTWGHPQMRSIEAQVLLLTRSGRFEPGMYHCVVRYRLGGRWFRDDPSARLGMPTGTSVAGEDGSCGC
jgi:hypothetical protein